MERTLCLQFQLARLLACSIPSTYCRVTYLWAATSNLAPTRDFSWSSHHLTHFDPRESVYASISTKLRSTLQSQLAEGKATPPSG